MAFSVSDYARADRPDFNPREAGQRYGAIIENLKAEVSGLKVPAVMRPDAVAFLIARWKGVQGAFFQCLPDTDRAAQGLCDAVRHLVATGHNNLDAAGSDWKSQKKLADMLVQECLEMPRPLQNLSEPVRLACEHEWPEELWTELVPLLCHAFGTQRP